MTRMERSLWLPLSRRPGRQRLVRLGKDLPHNFDQLAAGAIAPMRQAQIKNRAQGGLVAGLGISAVRRHKLFERAFGITARLWIGRSGGLRTDARMAPQGFQGGQKPGFVFAIGDDDLAGFARGDFQRPGSNPGGQFLGADWAGSSAALNSGCAPPQCRRAGRTRPAAEQPWPPIQS